jgi:ribose 5-phosphate isomerase RpiB
MPLITLAMSEVPKADAGLGSGLINVSQQMSAAIGVAVLGTLAASRTSDLLAKGHSQANALTSGFHFSFTIASCCVAIGIVVAATVLCPVRAAEQSQPTTEELRIREGLIADEMV